MTRIGYTTIIWAAMSTSVLLLEHQPAPAEEAKAANELLQAARGGQMEAIDALGRRGTEVPGALDTLVALLEDASPMVRAHAVHALGEMGESARPAVDALGKLITDPDARVRREVIRAFTKIRPGPAVSVPLLAKAMTDADPSVQVHVLDALAEVGKPVVPFLIKALENDQTAYWACLVISEIGPAAQEATDSLVERFRHDDRPEVRREALLALAAIGPGAAGAVPALTEALRDESNTVRFTAAYALGQMGPVAKSAQPALRELASEDAMFPKMIGTWALARIDPNDKELVRRAVPLLAEALKDKDARVRAVAARALADLEPGPEIAAPALRKALDGASPEVLNNALDALAALGESAVPRLTRALQYEEVRPKVASILGRIGPRAKAAVPALVAVLDDPNPRTRREILFALGKIGPEASAAVPAIIERLDDPDMDVRYSAVYALGRIGPAAMPAKPRLRETLDDSNGFLTLVSAWALARIHPECPRTSAASVPVLIAGLRDSQPLVRLNAAESLRCLGPRAAEAVPALKQAIQDENELVRDMAAEALVAIQGKK